MNPYRKTLILLDFDILTYDEAGQRRMRILTFNIRRMRMRMRIKEFISSVNALTGLCHLNDCNNMLFPKVNKISVHIGTV